MFPRIRSGGRGDRGSASPARFSSGGSNTSGRSSADLRPQPHRRVSSPIPIPGRSLSPKTVATNLMVVVRYLRMSPHQRKCIDPADPCRCDVEDFEEEECTMDLMLTPSVMYNEVTGEVTDLKTLGTIPDDDAVAVVGACVKLVTPPRLPDPVWRVNIKP